MRPDRQPGKLVELDSLAFVIAESAPGIYPTAEGYLRNFVENVEPFASKAMTSSEIANLGESQLPWYFGEQAIRNGLKIGIAKRKTYTEARWEDIDGVNLDQPGTIFGYKDSKLTVVSKELKGYHLLSLLHAEAGLLGTPDEMKYVPENRYTPVLIPEHSPVDSTIQLITEPQRRALFVSGMPDSQASERLHVTESYYREMLTTVRRNNGLSREQLLSAGFAEHLIDMDVLPPVDWDGLSDLDTTIITKYPFSRTTEIANVLGANLDAIESQLADLKATTGIASRGGWYLAALRDGKIEPDLPKNVE